MKQKFRKLTFVHVCKDMPEHMRHFDSDFDAVVDGTYSQLYGGKDIDSYSLWVIKNGKIVNKTAWYHEDQLTQRFFQNRRKAERMIEEYNLA